eukprot:5947632-Amphidinium_carterae.1
MELQWLGEVRLNRRCHLSLVLQRVALDYELQNSDKVNIVKADKVVAQEVPHETGRDPLQLSNDIISCSEGRKKEHAQNLPLMIFSVESPSNTGGCATIGLTHLQ